MSRAVSEPSSPQPPSLARKLQHLREPRMRRVVTAEYLGSAPAPTIVAALHQLIARSGTRDVGVAIALDSLTDALADPALVPYELRAALYSAAKRSERMVVARLFFDASPQRADDDSASERPLRPRGRPLTLGERKSLARSPRRQILQVIARDPHPEVVRIALGNSHLTEDDVIQMAARRPANPAALAVIARASRWRLRYRVRRALAKNPYTPSHLAIRLLLTLRTGDVRAVAADGQLSGLVREQARALLGVVIGR